MAERESAAAMPKITRTPLVQTTCMASMRLARSSSPRLTLNSMRETAIIPKGPAQNTVRSEFDAAKEERPTLPT